MTDDPRTSQPTHFPDEPHQPSPGLTTAMRTKPDHGEESYVGKGLLTDRIALITGGDSGIGRAVAIAYAREGADIAISYLADEQADAEETRLWVEKAGRRCLLLPGDIRDRDHCASLVERAVAELGGLDILVNNAAAQTMNEGLDSIDDDEMQDAFAANVFAMIRLAKAAAAHMKPGSAIINTTSEQAKIANKTMIVYAATKGAISSLTVGLSNLLASDGIRVNAVAPGPIWTPIQPIAKSPQELETLGHDTPIGRAGQPGELAPAYVLLASAEGSYMSGNVVAVTGGVPIS
ncbi:MULTISPECIES: SDR family oxidoreductase [unclassified Sphingomonas]|uniref:SDR family oxidoreductase n=1 Tax=unclassified Sphingomonas TaxID=196159 RepID=UPI0028668870|nr:MULTISPECIES: SDR family oxidoreductase [unclassified Sphingomonas]MDR6116102.1 NAD(P)-dependent dehydrogenase (short-subunit alcohol dehydrogenase family) [Sphingomonas sp. SORGH_AS_0789]MDR6150225.1 NAD(P)-dependent dehydrogenase (short-subunit alcohol dehydrogenase family) [Sphingomonas sp. SORGH_AS_0742]